MSSKKFAFIPSKCQLCKGTCRVENNPTKTQENARKLFNGTIPHNCVDSFSGKQVIQIHCPYA